MSNNTSEPGRLRVDNEALRQRVAALEHEASRFKATLYSIGDAVIATDAASVIVQMNPAAEALTGWSEAEARGRAAAEVFHVVNEATGAEVESPVTRVLSEGVVVGLANHTMLVARDGTRRPIADSGAPIRGDDGAVTGVVLVFRDQTRERAAQQARAERAEANRLQAELLHAAPVIAVFHDRSNNILWANRAYEQATGLSQKEIVGRKCWAVWRLTQPCQGCPVLTAIDSDMASEAELTPQNQEQWPESQGCWLSRAAPVHDGDGKVIGAIEVAIDITDRKRVEHRHKQAENALRESEQRFMNVLYASRDAILLIDGDKFVDCNEATVRMLGYPDRDAFLKTHPSELSPPTQPDGRNSFEKANDMMNAAFRSGFHQFEWEHRKASGEDFPVEVSLTSIMLNGNNVLHCVWRDITERKQAEANRQQLEGQLRASQKMEAIGSLAGGVAHDFNNLLSVILSYTGFAIARVGNDDPIKNDLLEVKQAGERAATLTHQLLAFSRKQVLQPVPLILNEIALGVEKMLRRILGEDIDFVQVLAPDLGVVLADPGQMEQVLMNLVVNARDAMPEGGKLTIETANVEINQEYAARHVAVKPGPYVQLVVTDTGCGMDPETRARLFEPFFTTKDKGKGTGLGLSTVYGIIKQSGGNIWVYSEPGLGTTFKIYLPRDLAATTATALRPTAVPRPTTGTETILVVEDEEALLTVARRALAAAGYTVLTAAAGAEALRISAEHAGDIHLLLTDVVMPRMSGKVLAQELARTRPGLKNLYMSGYTDNAIVHHGVLDAGTQFLPKPFTAADLTRKVREVLDGSISNLADGHEQAAKDVASVKEEQPLDKDALRAVPRDVLSKLRRAVTAARHDEIVLLIETIRMTEPKVAAGLRRMADRFDHDGLRGLLGQAKEE